MLIHKKGIEYTQVQVQLIKRQLILCKEELLENRFLRPHDHKDLEDVLEQFLVVNSYFEKYCEDSSSYLESFENHLTQLVVMGAKYNLNPRLLDKLHGIQLQYLRQLQEALAHLDHARSHIELIAEIQEYQDFDDFAEMDHLIEANTVQEEQLHRLKATSMEMAVYVEQVITKLDELDDTVKDREKYAFLKREEDALTTFDENIRSWLEY